MAITNAQQYQQLVYMPADGGRLRIIEEARRHLLLVVVSHVGYSGPSRDDPVVLVEVEIWVVVQLIDQLHNKQLILKQQ
jgi:hypothetical protein